MPDTPIKKKYYTELARVTTFMATQSAEINEEYRGIVERLELEGRLSMPFGEKIRGENLFAIRVINTGNVRIFYLYGKENHVYGLSAYEKKTQTIPQHELDSVRQIARMLKRCNFV